MPALANDLRRDLEKVVKEARAVAERGAKAALESLTVHEAKSGGHLDEAGRKLRSRLRALAKQLGDKRETSGAQQIARLVRACAYEHWHRMLFARFLAENDLLIHPEHKVAVTLEEVEELAREEGVDQWELASRYAERMLPQIFRRDDPLLGVALPRERRLELEALLDSLPVDTLQADDSLGWTYQFWQAAEKDRVNDSSHKITGETLPAVTQLFTEHYMVHFLLHNTIGAWHAGKTLTDVQRRDAGSEQELRDAVRLEPLAGYDFDYLRFVREPREGQEPDAATGPWHPAAGAYEGWPKTAAQLRVLDPCCGSGHFLVAAFDLLVRLRIAEDGLDTEAAIRAVLADNLFGLELDPRCTQIAAFNLAFAAWKLAGRPIDLPALNIACSGIGPQSTKDEWLKMAEPELARERPDVREAMRRGLIHLHELFSDAPELGSLIDPSVLPTEGFAADFETIKPLFDRIVAADSADDDTHERAVAARGMAATAAILDSHFDLAITNVPYLGNRKQGDILRAHCEQNFASSKQDLATVFLERILRLLPLSGAVAAVTPQYWLFLSSYSAIRENLLRDDSIVMLAKLGPGAFETISGEVVNAALVCCIRGKDIGHPAISTLDVSGVTGVAAKSASLIASDPIDLRVHEQLQNPDCRIGMEAMGTGAPLHEHVVTPQGIKTGDDARFVRVASELLRLDCGWEPYQTSVKKSALYDGRHLAIDWRARGNEMVRPRLKNVALGRCGVGISQVGGLPATLYSGERYDSSIAVIVPNEPAHAGALWIFCSSPQYRDAVRTLDQKTFVTNNTLAKVRCDLGEQLRRFQEVYPSGLPEPESDDPTQWLFHGRPERAEAHATLQVGVARLVGYRWPAELDEDMRLAPEARALVRRCAELAEHADDDGIVCLSSVRGEPSASDRLERLLRAAFGDTWSAGKAHDLLAAAGANFNKGKAEPSIKDWLRDRFFEEHCALFHSRPFVWHIWDGKKDGFHALVNYHKLAAPGGVGRQTLETLTYAYLGDWITKQKQQVDAGTPGAEARLAAANELKAQLEEILEGEPPYDLFIRWKPLHEQPIGWEPDINDGVRLNIRPFMMAADVGKKGAGVLRAMPKSIKWGSDGGKESHSLRPKADFPWFWSWDERTQNFTGGAEFDGVRWNDLHYTNAAKQAARERAAKEVEA